MNHSENNKGAVANNYSRGLIWVFLLFIGTHCSYASTIVVEGEITDHSQVDHWSFVLGADSTLTIDVLAHEASTIPVDFFNNGDGNDLLDPVIYLFQDSTSGDLIGFNDDSNSNLGLDGSTIGLDSYLTLPNVSEGTYVLAIGDWLLTEEDARNGLNEGTAGTFDRLGRYQITFTADQIAMVPITSELHLLVLGLFALTRFLKTTANPNRETLNFSDRP